MEKLTLFGHMRKNIFVKFLKENKIYGYFLANILHYRNKFITNRSKRSINNIFNVNVLRDINFDDFFPIYRAKYPSNLTFGNRFTYWNNWKGKWAEYIWRQEYKKYNIW